MEATTLGVHLSIDTSAVCWEFSCCVQNMILLLKQVENKLDVVLNLKNKAGDALKHTHTQAHSSRRSCEVFVLSFYVLSTMTNLSWEVEMILN